VAKPVALRQILPALLEVVLLAQQVMQVVLGVQLQQLLKVLSQ
jgi:hypothetical protein